jgi:hypothetical protein
MADIRVADVHRGAGEEPSRQRDSPYHALIEIGLERARDKYRYPKAIKTIRRLRDSYQRAGEEAGFLTYLADLRQRHHRKTSFIAKLDKALVRH